MLEYIEILFYIAGGISAFLILKEFYTHAKKKEQDIQRLNEALRESYKNKIKKS